MALLLAEMQALAQMIPGLPVAPLSDDTEVAEARRRAAEAEVEAAFDNMPSDAGLPFAGQWLAKALVLPVNWRQGARWGGPEAPRRGQGMAAAEGDIRVEITEDGVHVLTLDHPPVNALSPALRGALLEALARAAEAGARAVVLAGAGRNFSAATTVDVAPGRPTLAELCAAVEDMPCPVVAALQGAAVGPGAELALAAHARVMLDGARLVWPEVGLGLVTEGGTTQRLPRIVGASEALDILLRARAVPATEALALGLADRLVETGPLPAALDMARAMPGPRPVRDRVDGLGGFVPAQEAIAAARAEAARGILPAPPRIIDCVEAALILPFEKRPGHGGGGPRGPGGQRRNRRACGPRPWPSGGRRNCRPRWRGCGRRRWRCWGFWAARRRWRRWRWWR